MHPVLESEAWIEITNGVDVVSIRRTSEMEGRNENLITVYHSSLDCIHNPETFIEDMYVHSANSTTSAKGFHSFLEKFIGLELPVVQVPMVLNISYICSCSFLSYLSSKSAAGLICFLPCLF